MVLKRRALTYLVLTSFAISPLSVAPAAAKAEPSTKHATKSAHTVKKSKPTPVTCIKQVCHHQRWWKRLATYIEAATRAKMAAWFQAVGAPGRAVAWAKQQVGKPYRYGATGPDSFDCSGLTMMAWAEGGVSMPHYSGAQYAMFPKVSGALRLGDLIFRGTNGSQHVSMYVGDGQQITAPSTGSFVRIEPVGPNIGAVRPS